MCVICKIIYVGNKNRYIFEDLEYVLNFFLFCLKRKKRVFLVKKIIGIKGDNYILLMFLIFLFLIYFCKYDCLVCFINNLNFFFKGLVKIFKRKFGVGKEMILECLRVVVFN